MTAESSPYDAADSILVWREIEQELVDAGYRVDLYDAIDTPIAGSTPCPRDGLPRRYEGRRLLPRGREHGSYRAFAVCRRGHAQEF